MSMMKTSDPDGLDWDWETEHIGEQHFVFLVLFAFIFVLIEPLAIVARFLRFVWPHLSGGFNYIMSV